MLQKIKDALNSSVLWIVFLVGWVFYLWKKEGDAENKLEEEKADETLKEQKEAVHDADLHSDADNDHYNDLRRQYLEEHPEDR